LGIQVFEYPVAVVINNREDDPELVQKLESTHFCFPFSEAHLFLFHDYCHNMRNQTKHFVDTMMEKNPARQPRKNGKKKKVSGALALAPAASVASVALAPAVSAPSSKAAAKPPSPTVANVVVANVSETTMAEAEAEAETADTNDEGRTIKIKNSADGQKMFEWLDCVKTAGGFTVHKDDADVDEHADVATSYEAFRDCIKRVLAGANLCLPAGSGYNPEKWLRKSENFEGFDFSIGVQAATATATATTAAAATKVRICFMFVFEDTVSCVFVFARRLRALQALETCGNSKSTRASLSTRCHCHEALIPENCRREKRQQ
jgi:hypothetical protein